VPTTYHLTLQDQFQCLAGNCPASCCSGWQIEVEPELVERWKNLPDPVDRERFPALIRHEVSGDTHKLFMTGRDRPRCGLLNSENLCDAHARYGVESTPLTCRSFPRMQELAGTIRMESASPACPVIAQRIVTEDRSTPLFRRTPRVEAGEVASEEAISRIGLTDLQDRLMHLDEVPIGIRVYWLAGQVSLWSADPALIPARLAALNNPPEALHKELREVASRVESGSLRADPVIAGSFWNTIFQLGYSRQLFPDFKQHGSTLGAGLHGLPGDRRGFYLAVYDEVMGLRNHSALKQQSWFAATSGRLLHLHLLNAGFPWQPSLGDDRLSFAHAIIFYSLAFLAHWLVPDKAPASTDSFIRAVYRTGRAFGHNTLIPSQINANPALLDLGRYHATFLDF